MDNSLVTHLSGYVRAMFLDIEHAYTRSSEWRRDQTRLLHELENRGSSVLTLDLPALAKHLDWCLDRGSYSASQLRLGRLVSDRVQVPRFARELYLKIFDNEGMLREVVCMDALVALRQLLCGAKKLDLQCAPWRTTEAVNDFLDIESRMRSFTLDWDCDALLERRSALGDIHFVDAAKSATPDLFSSLEDNVEPSFDDLYLTQTVFDIVASKLGVFDSLKTTMLPKHGPGVVANLKNEDSKYSFPNWPLKLSATFPPDYFRSPNLGSDYDQGLKSDWSLHEAPSRLISVPKTLKGPRLIAAEPVEHQWVQQLLWRELEDRISHGPLSRSIDFRSQELSQRSALEASRDGRKATVDLSSASDRLSCWLVERAFRANYSFLEAFHACRTRWLENRVRPSLGRFMRLKKFAPMGSACTFPVQSIVYCGLAMAAVLITERRRPTERNMRLVGRQIVVFGDDIVIPSAASATFLGLLTYAGLKVNITKTYTKGNFRESCGVDAFRGVDITPVYVRRLPKRATPSSYSSLVESSNNFHRKGFWRVGEFLLSLLPKSAYASMPITGYEEVCPGVKSFCGRTVDHLKSRWSPDLHQVQYRTLLPYGRMDTGDSDGYSRLHQWFIDEPLPDALWAPGRTRRVASNWKLGWSPLEYGANPYPGRDANQQITLYKGGAFR